jgi:hypothetical protein
MRVRSVACVAFAAAVGTVGCSLPPKPLIVSCKTAGDQMDVVDLDPAGGHATLLSVSPALSGTVHASPTEFDVVFQPGPDKTPRLRLRINRYTFRATRETGEQATDAAAAGSQTVALCERFKAKPL